MDLFEKRSHALFALSLSIVFFMFLEILILLTFSSASGEWSMIEVKDKLGNVVHQARGASVADLDRWYFEKSHGNLSNYDIGVTTINKPFPVRAWVCASIGVPIVLMLLLSYLVKIYLALLQGNGAQTGEGALVAYRNRHSLLTWAMFLGSHSVYYLGALIGVAALTFWMVPSFLADLFATSLSIVQESKWPILGPVLFLAVLGIWVVYLRYRLSRRMMDHQFNLERYRLNLELQLQSRLPVSTLATEDEGGIVEVDDHL